MKKSIWQTLFVPLVLGLLIFLNGYTLFHAVTDWKIGILSLLLCLLLLFAGRFFYTKNEAWLKRFSLGVWLVMLILQVLYILNFHNNIRYDAYWVLDQAVEMLDTHQFSSTLSNAYFTQVPNNYGITLITYWFLILVKALGVPASGYMTAVQFLNLLCLDGSLLFMVLTIRKTKSPASAAFFLSFCALTPFVYVWAPYYYTSTTSMLFAFAAVWLWLVIRDTASTKKQCLLTLVLGFLCITSFKVRATSLIAYIAIFLYWTVKHEKGSLKKHLRPLAVFVLSVFLSFFLWKGIISFYVPFDTTDTALPVTHFMMMGSRRDGSFNQDDLRYSISLPTKEAKLEGTLSVIKERLTENGFTGNLQLLLRKQLNCWVDGTDAYNTENALCREYNTLHTYILGSKSDLLASYAQALRVIQLFWVCVSCLFSWKRKKADERFLLALNLLGGMAFQLLWETSPLYSIAFTFFSYALVTDGIEEWNSCKLAQKKAVPYVFAGLSGALLGFTAVFAVTQWSFYTQEEQTVSDFVVNQHMQTEGETGPAMQVGQTWFQTFVAEDPFNTLDLYFGNSSMEGNTSVYRIALAEEGKSLLLFEELFYGNNTGYDIAYEFQFAPVIPEGKTTYQILITPLAQDENNYIHFGSQDCSRVDLYPEGTLSIDGEDTQRDLSFRIRERHIATRATKKEYSLIAILLILLELFLFVKSLRLINEKRRTIAGRI